MRRLLYACLFVLTACTHAPGTRHCPETCERIRATWDSTQRVLDPNDPSRPPWCVCTRGIVTFCMPGHP